MALGQRLDLRQAQTLVMTPQLRQAIKLLQYSNIEVAGFIEVPQVGAQFIEEFARKTVAHRLDDFATVLVQER